MSTDASQVLQHSYFIAAAAVVLALVALRIIVLRRRSQALSDFFRLPSSSQYPYGSHPQNDTGRASIYNGVQLAPLPAAYCPDRRIHAADTDAYGRRLGSSGGDWDGKDALPAYDNLDRPPKYIEAGWSQGGSAQPPIPQAAASEHTDGEQSGAVHPDTTTGNTLLRNSSDQPYVDTHTEASVVHVTNSALPQHDLPGS